MVGTNYISFLLKAKNTNTKRKNKINVFYVNLIQKKDVA